MKATVELRVLNELGLHARPATEFVKCALRFRSTIITFTKDGQTFTASSILEVLSAELDQGSEFFLEADGPDAEQVVEAFTALMIQIQAEEKSDRQKK